MTKVIIILELMIEIKLKNEKINLRNLFFLIYKCLIC